MAKAPLPVRKYIFREVSKVAADFLGQYHPSGEFMHLERLSEKGRNIVIGGVAKVFDVSPALMKRRLTQDRLL